MYITSEPIHSFITYLLRPLNADTAKTLEMSQQNKDPCHDGAYSACVWEGAGSTHQHNNEHVVR